MKIISVPFPDDSTGHDLVAALILGLVHGDVGPFHERRSRGFRFALDHPQG